MNCPSEQDLALLNDGNAIRVLVNGSEKFIAKDWLEGKGRGANSILAEQVLGTKEGLSGSTELTIDDEFVPVFDILFLWLCLGDGHVRSSLTEENASALYGLASYFELKHLEAAITSEQEQREQIERERIERERRERLYRETRERIEREILNHQTQGLVRCVV